MAADLLNYLTLEGIKLCVGPDAWEAFVGTLGEWETDEEFAALEVKAGELACKMALAIEAEINACLCKHFVTPITDPSGIAMLESWALDMITYEIAKRWCSDEIPEKIKDCYEKACAKVEGACEKQYGCFELLPPEDGGGTGVIAKLCPPKFNKECLKGY